MIQLEQLRAAVLEEVSIAGEDHVYDYVDENDGTCVYVDDAGNGSCLIGLALMRLGFSADDLIGLYGVEAYVPRSGGVYPNYETISNRMDLPLSTEARNWATIVQNIQDECRPWGEAVSLADESVEQ